MTYELKLREWRDEWKEIGKEEGIKIGKEEGIRIGKEEGKEVGEYTNKVSVIRNMNNSISEDLLVKATGLDANKVNEIIDLIGLYPEKTDTEIAEMVFENLRSE